MLSNTRNTISRSRTTASAIRSQHSARIDMVAIALATAAALLVRFNIVPGIGW